MKLEKGQIVKFKRTLKVNQNYGSNTWVQEMEDYKNKKYVIIKPDPNEVILRELESEEEIGYAWTITKEMLSEISYGKTDSSIDLYKEYPMNEISKDRIVKVKISSYKEEICNYINKKGEVLKATISLHKADHRHEIGGRTKQGYGWYPGSSDVLGLLELTPIYLKENISVYEICSKDIGKHLSIEGWTDKYYLEKPVVKEDEYYLVENIEYDNHTYSVVLNETKKGIFVIDKSILEQYSTTKEINEKEVETAQTQLDLGILANEVKELTKEIKQREPFQKAITEAIIEKGKEIAIKDLEDRLKDNLDEYIERKYGILPKQIVIQTEESTKELQGIFHNQFENICKIVKKDIPLMLVGAAGAGKNHTLEQVAEALDLTFYSTGSISQEYKLTGFIDAGGKYHETEFYKAFTNGGLFFLDEIDASSPEVLVQLNGAIANGYFEFPTGRVNKHKDFRVVCAGNTFGTGADMIYVGRNVLDGATLDRFVVLDFDYDEEVEKQLAYNQEILDFIRDLRKAVNESSLRYIVGMRALINASKMLEIGFDKKTILKSAIIKNMQIDDLNTVVKKINSSTDWGKELKGLTDLC